MLTPFEGISPKLDPSVLVQPGAHIIGDVEIGADSSVWFNVVIRGDVNRIRIGARTNIQDNATVHVTSQRWPTAIGDDVTVGHGAIIHGCTVGSRCLIGIGSIVLDGAVVEDGCLVGAGAVVTPGTRLPAGSLVLGSPAKVVRPLRPEELQQIAASAQIYVALAGKYR